MTISSQTRKAGPFVGNGTVATFPFTFKVFQASDLQLVKLNSTTNVETQLVLTTDYTVSLNANQNTNPGGTITLTAGVLPTGYKLTITTSIAPLQAVDLTNSGGFYPSVINAALDKLTILVQQIIERAGRTLTLPLSTPTDVSASLPAPQANAFIGWDQTGKALQNYDNQSLATVVAYGTAKGDIFAGDGSTTQFNLTNNPGALNNLDVSVGGVTQLPNTDYTWNGGTLVTFTSAPASGASVFVRYMQGLPFGTVQGADVIGGVMWVDTIAGFSATGVTDGTAIYFKGRDAVGDGGGGQFRYSAPSTQTADGVYVFAPVGGGRLLRDGWTVLGFNGVTRAAWSGADTAADPTSAIQQLVNVSAGKPIRLTNDRIYTLSAQITIPSTGLVIDGNDMDSCGFSYSGSFDLFVGAGSVGNLLPSVRLSDLIVKKTGGTTGQLFKLTLAETPLLTSVRFDGANGANPAYLMLLGCKYAGIASCKFTGGASAFWGSSDMTATGVWGESNTAFKCVADAPKQGFNVTYQRDFTGLMCSSFGASSTYGCGWVIEYENNGVNLAFCNSHNNIRAGFYVEGNVAFGCQNINFTGCNGYTNGEAGINLDANFRHVSVSGGAYYGNTGVFAAGTGHGIMGAGSRYVSIGGAVSLYGNAGSGIWYNNAFDLKIGETDIRDNAKYGIDLQGTKALIRIGAQTSFSANTLGNVNGWTYLGSNEWQGGPWEAWTPTFYKQNETTTVTFSTLAARWRRDNGRAYYELVAVTPSVALDSYTFFSIPVVGTWPDNSSGSQALLPRGFAGMDVTGTQPVDGAFANDKLRIAKTAAGDTTIRASGSFEV